VGLGQGHDVVYIELSGNGDFLPVVEAVPLALSDPSSVNQRINKRLFGKDFLPGVEAIAVGINPVIPIISVVSLRLFRGDSNEGEQFGQGDPSWELRRSRSRCWRGFPIGLGLWGR
jgi:hypothetical protein